MDILIYTIPSEFATCSHLQLDRLCDTWDGLSIDKKWYYECDVQPAARVSYRDLCLYY